MENNISKLDIQIRELSTQFKDINETISRINEMQRQFIEEEIKQIKLERKRNFIYTILSVIIIILFIFSKIWNILFYYK